MFLNCAAYFGMPEVPLRSIIDFLIHEHMSDGGFNCESNHGGAVHSSLHSTLSVLEGLFEYAAAEYAYRSQELLEIVDAAREFILQHRLYRSDRTGDVIDKRMLLLSFPSRWKYDVLRALDYFRAADLDYDSRMEDALEVLIQKMRKDGRWPLQGRHPGKTHFEMEPNGQPSRWNTLRALRVLEHFNVVL
jgi:hypothetical protein